MRNESSKSALFLMELILAILFFALSSAVCAQLFATAHLTSQKTQDANHAATLAQSAIACVQSANGDLQTAAPLLHGSVEKNGDLVVWYDAAWQTSADSTNAVYCLKILPELSAERAEVSVLRGENVLLSLVFGWHQPLHL